MLIPSLSTTLTDGKVLLRPFQLADVPVVFAAVRESMAEVSPWMAWCHPDYSLEDTQSWIEVRDAEWLLGNEFAFAITSAANGQFLGSCGLNTLNELHRLCNLGYWVRTSHAGRGIATRATKLVATWGLQELGLRRIEIVAAEDNLASQRVAEKAGAVREGVLRNRLLHGGVSIRAVMFSLVPDQ